jgi:GrpB-like predicted nucleotidyltransferase (UPF0157 family)
MRARGSDQNRVSGNPVPDDVELIGGPEHREIVLVGYDPDWPKRFDAEKRRIHTAMAAVQHRIEHVGSTSVPTMIAKPIIDIQLSIPDVDLEQVYVPVLEAVGYELRVRERGHRLLRTHARDVHLHVCSSGSEWERRHVLFRDWLRVSPSDRARYREAKEDLARRDWPTVNHYADAKSPVIAEITRRAERWAAATGWSIDDPGTAVGVSSH